MKENEILLTLRKHGVEVLLSMHTSPYLGAGILVFGIGALLLILFLNIPKAGNNFEIAYGFCIFMMVIGALRIYFSLKIKPSIEDPMGEKTEYGKFCVRCGGNPKGVEQQILAEADEPDSFQSRHLLLTKSYLIVKNCAYSKMWGVYYYDRGITVNYPMYTIMRLDDIIYGRYIWDNVESHLPKGTAARPPRKGPVLILYDRYGQRLRHEEESELDFSVQQLISMLHDRFPQADIDPELSKDTIDVITTDYQLQFENLS